MEPNKDRYQRAIRRCLAEAQNAILKRTALVGLHKAESSHGLDFFRICDHALYNDYISHAIRLFERSDQAASFWYVLKSNEAAARAAAVSRSVSIPEIDALTERLKGIRDKTHFHIDREAVVKPSEVWSEAAITGDELSQAIDAAWEILAALHENESGSKVELPDYDGSDVEMIIRAYTQVNPDVAIVI